MSEIAPNLVLIQQKEYDTDLIWTSALCIYVAEKNGWKTQVLIFGYMWAMKLWQV